MILGGYAATQSTRQEHPRSRGATSASIVEREISSTDLRPRPGSARERGQPEEIVAKLRQVAASLDGRKYRMLNVLDAELHPAGRFRSHSSPTLRPPF